MTAAIVEFPKTNSDVLRQLLATAMKLEASEESEACISIQREIICTLLMDNQKKARTVMALSKALHHLRYDDAEETA